MRLRLCGWNRNDSAISGTRPGARLAPDGNHFGRNGAPGPLRQRAKMAARQNRNRDRDTNIYAYTDTFADQSLTPLCFE
jgi:hypothetical protein